MVSTRSGAGKAIQEDKENTLALRKKPVRRATAKAAKPLSQPESSARAADAVASENATPHATTTRATAKAAAPTTRTTRRAATPAAPSDENIGPAKPTRKAASVLAEKAQPLSPKKITQVARAPVATRDAEGEKPVAAANVRPRRPLRAAITKAPEKEKEKEEVVPRRVTTKAPVPSRVVAKAPVSRGRPRKVISGKAAAEIEKTPEVPEEVQEEVLEIEEKENQKEEEDEEEQPEEEERNENERDQSIQEPAEDDIEEEEEDQSPDDTENEPIGNGEANAETDVASPAQPGPSTSKSSRNGAPALEENENESEDDLTLQPASVASKSPVKKGKSRVSVMADDSDDEICGPKTPMRRGWTPAKSRTSSSFGTASRRLQTPTRRLVVHRTQQGTPQTQKVPIKAPAPASAQRPMTVARGLDKPMVFRPLPTPEDHSNTAEPSPSQLGNLHEHVDESLMVAEPTSSEEDLLQETEPTVVLEEQDDAQYTAQYESESEDELQCSTHSAHSLTAESDDDDELLLDAPNDDVKEPNYEDETPLASDDETDDQDEDFDEDEETLVKPHLPTELLQSSPAPTAPEISDDTDVDMTMSDAQSSPAPSTPGLVAMYDDVAQSSPVPSTPGSVSDDAVEADSPTQEQAAPVPRLSLNEEDHEDDSEDNNEDDSEDDDTIDLSKETFGTPAAASRLSFNTRMLQTPHMRGFRESLANATSVSCLDQRRESIPFQSNCIDPALLSTQEEAFDLSQEADALAILSPERLSYTLAAQAETLQPASAIPGRLSIANEDPRLSLLVESLLIAPADYIPSPRRSLDTSFRQHSAPVAQMMSEDIPSSYPEIDNVIFEEDMEMSQQMEMELAEAIADAPIDVVQEVTSQPVDTNHVVCEEEGVLQTPIVPRYAQPTVASEVRRRQSMPAFGAVTPRSLYNRPATAETTIKPITSDAFAKLWANKEQRHKAGRRSSIRRATFAPIAQSATPKSARTIMVERSEPRTLRLRKSRTSEMTPSQQSSIQIVEQAATPNTTPSLAKPRKHTPSSKSARPRTPQPPPRTPMKTPLKAPGATPAAYPMTPHPSQPLRSVTALVEIFTLDGSSASSPFIALLQRLGARTTKTWSERVTHVVFKDGSPATLQKVRLANKSTEEGKKEIFCVNSRWVTDCDKEGKKMDERSEEYAIDLDSPDVKSKAAGRSRRRKSMEPASLRNIDGNVVATDVAGTKSRRGSVSRKSMARVSLASTFWGTPGMSPMKGGELAAASGSAETDTTPTFGKENQDDEDQDDSFWNEADNEAGTPVLSHGYMNRQQELEMLQRTAPVNRMRKLRLKGQEGEGRRLSYFPGRE